MGSSQRASRGSQRLAPFLAALALLLIAVTLSWPPQKALSEPGPQRIAVEQRDAEANRRSRLDLKAQQSMAKAAWVQAALSLAGILLLGFTLIYTAKATRAANRAAKAAEGAVTATRDSSRRELRAYMSVDKVTHDPTFIKVTLQNTGHTPATELKGTLTPYWEPGSNTDLSPGFTFNEVTVPILFPGAVGGGREAKLRFDLEASETTSLERALSDEVTLFILVRLVYKDIFGDAHEPWKASG